jgi:dephospho-CoA kinase
MLARVQRILLTGMSGVGKSSVIGRLAARGFKAVDFGANLRDDSALHADQGVGDHPGLQSAETLRSEYLGEGVCRPRNDVAFPGLR